ncbi:c-type cytochrome [Dyadobacter fanqingshengii]|uniref:PQQ-dependent sugar dehydrogenase n=1 Tax=Dyadobacter fanqingshengii TaxID=2906443 RepID=A0A9X1T912_9BACT|nr:c-type cytochrome [Dyadobacter fanqingshengii]MCF0040251.1 PQQ-dependent sugar dehydrogenase [Dyadobacter fanqingshengii]USJ38001.1 PQQ-dependent sugar dehydrogenase [Dyadobacter fanqingshengii]
MRYHSFKLSASLLLLFALGFTQRGDQQEVPVNTKNGGLFLPDGFEATVVVDSLPGRARHIAVNDNGDIYVKARFADKGESVTALRDTNGDGRADMIKRFGGRGGEGVYGTAMRIYKGYLYFSSELIVYRYKLKPGELVPTSEEEVILTDDHAHGMHEHIAKPVTFDDKGFMYVPFGANSNACQDDNRIPSSSGLDPCPILEDHGGIWRFDANKKGQLQKDGVKFATGLRSVVALDWNFADNNLYALQHGRDDLLRLFSQLFSPWQSAMLPSEEFFRIKEGTHAGWPYCYWDQMQGKKVLNPEYGGDGNEVGRCGEYEKPLIGFPGHWAPNDILFYQGNHFPDRYKNGSFIAFHGSTNRAPYPQSSYFIGFVPFKAGQPSGDYEVFADGFAGVDPIVNVSDAVYRPMGLAMGPDGALYIAETEKGKIWKVTYKGNKQKFTKSALVKMEKRKAMSNIRTPDKINDNLDKDKPVAGGKVYSVYCSACHQRNGMGDSQRFPPLGGAEWVTGDKERLIKVLLKGLEGPLEVKGQSYNNVMPQHSFLKDEEIAEVLTHIRSNFGNNASAVTIDEVAKTRSSLDSLK